MWDVLFNPQGRMNRKPFILIPIALGFLNLLPELAKVFNAPFIQYFIVSWLFTLTLTYISFVFYIKRFHDLDKSGWNVFWIFVPLVNIIIAIRLVFKKGTEGENRFGLDPLGGSYRMSPGATVKKENGVLIALLGVFTIFALIISVTVGVVIMIRNMAVKNISSQITSTEQELGKYTPLMEQLDTEKMKRDTLVDPEYEAAFAKLAKIRAKAQAIDKKMAKAKKEGKTGRYLQAAEEKLKNEQELNKYERLVAEKDARKAKENADFEQLYQQTAQNITELKAASDELNKKLNEIKSMNFWNLSKQQYYNKDKNAWLPQTPPK